MSPILITLAGGAGWMWFLGFVVVEKTYEHSTSPLVRLALAGAWPVTMPVLMALTALGKAFPAPRYHSRKRVR